MEKDNESKLPGETAESDDSTSLVTAYLSVEGPALFGPRFLAMARYMRSRISSAVAAERAKASAPKLPSAIDLARVIATAWHESSARRSPDVDWLPVARAALDFLAAHDPRQPAPAPVEAVTSDLEAVLGDSYVLGNDRSGATRKRIMLAASNDQLAARAQDQKRIAELERAVKGGVEMAERITEQHGRIGAPPGAGGEDPMSDAKKCGTCAHEFHCTISPRPELCTFHLPCPEPARR